MIVDGIQVLTGATTSANLTDAGGLIASAQLPSIAISDTFVVTSQAAMLALTAQTGDIAIRTDVSKSYILATTDPTTLSNWHELIGGSTQVNADWNSATGVTQILNKPTLATVATSGSYNDLTNKPTIPAAIYDIAGSMLGKPANAATVARLVAVRAFTIPAGVAGSLCVSGTAATATTVYNLKKNDAIFGTITFAASGTTGTFAAATQTAFAIGDVFSVTAPATADTTHADMQFTIITALV
jgi:hypothetical protein